MENENLTPEQEGVVTTTHSPLHTVTPLSKYLAMTLFIVLPFFGGWIGYTYAPEKTVEVEKVVVQEKITETDYISDKQFVTQAEKIGSEYVIGSSHYGWTLTDTSSSQRPYKVFFEPAESEAYLEGTLSISYDAYVHDSYILRFKPSSKEHALPDVALNSPDSSILFSMESIELFPASYEGEAAAAIQKMVSDFCGSDCLLSAEASFEEKNDFRKVVNVLVKPHTLTRFYLDSGTAALENLWIDEIKLVN